MTSYPKAAGTPASGEGFGRRIRCIRPTAPQCRAEGQYVHPVQCQFAQQGAKKVAFFDKLAVAFAECPTDSYFTYTQLKDAGVTVADAVLTDSEEQVPSADCRRAESADT